jgi:hypothetical protein
MHKYIYNAVFHDEPSPASIFGLLHSPLHESTAPFTYLEILLLVIVVRISTHSRPWLVINCSALAA